MRDLKPNPIVAAWESGRPAISAWSIIPGKLSAEMLALLDFDVVTIDLQHSNFDRSDITAAITAIQAAGSAAGVRVPWNDDPGLAMALLDFGLASITCPYVGSRAECERFVRACRYPPLGIRNSNIPRASAYRRNLGAYFDSVRRRELVIAMVESVSGLDVLDDIAATPGLDVIQLGPSDLVAVALRPVGAGRRSCRVRRGGAPQDRRGRPPPRHPRCRQRNQPGPRPPPDRARLRPHLPRLRSLRHGRPLPHRARRPRRRAREQTGGRVGGVGINCICSDPPAQKRDSFPRRNRY
jgi:2-keto-3-deoxy-L-rhamnonate aldolase RhmA